jgi:hypothetical protein
MRNAEVKDALVLADLNPELVRPHGRTRTRTSGAA